MSEPKRVVPQCLEFPDSLGHATKKEKKREKGKQLAPSFRFTIALPESNDKTYSEFNYAQLVKSKEKNRRKEEERIQDENATNGLDPFDDADDEKLREMASRFEAKYGTATAGRKRHKHDDYVDLGAGYDENDSFIDNTDAYDEIVPHEVTTAFGGFYINSGPLEFKPADENSPVNNRLNNNNNNNNNEDEEEESSEESAEDEEDEGNRVLQRMEKRLNSCSDEDDDDEIIPSDSLQKKRKSEEMGDKKSSNDNVMKKKRKLQGESCNANNSSNQQCDDIEGMTNAGKNFNDEKREVLDVDCSSEDQEERKRAKYDTTKTKSSAPPDKKYDLKKMERKIEVKRTERKQQQQQQQQPSSNGIDAKKIDLKKFIGKDSNIDDAIESVVNAGRADDESSRDTMDSGKSHFPQATDSECDENDKEDIPLPEQLPDDIKDIIGELKVLAEKNREIKAKIFDENFNSALLILEQKLRVMNSPSARLLTYGHLAPFLRCNKAALVNRAKKLCLQDAEKRLKEPLKRLKLIIEDVMPGVVERYTKECQRVAEEKCVESSPVEIDSSDENTEKSKIPRKKFPWSTEMKKLIYEIACARRHYFKMKKPKKESVDTAVATYMESKVLPLWPGGWMRLQTLLKYSNPEPVEKRKQKKSRDPGLANSQSTSGLANCPARQEQTGLSFSNVSTTTQDRAPTPTNPAKLNVDDQSVNYAGTFNSNQQKNNSCEIQQGERRTSAKAREKNCLSPSTIVQDNHASSCVRETMAKITVVPTSQLIIGHNKSTKCINEKFNPLDLTSSSLSITPVNDYPKANKAAVTEMKKDIVSITPYSELTTTTTAAAATTTAATTTTTTTTTTVTETTTTMTTTTDTIACNFINDSGTRNHKQRVQEFHDVKTEKRHEDRTEFINDAFRKIDKREKKRERWHDEKQRSHDARKRRKEHNNKGGEQHFQQQSSAMRNDVSAGNTTTQQQQQQQQQQQSTSSLTKEEQEQRQIEETMAATNFLSQIINDDLPARNSSDSGKRKEQTIIVDDSIGNIVVQQNTEQDNDVQMVMRSLKELQELQEMKYSPSHAPLMGQQKSGKTSHQYANYQDDYPRIYNKKDDKMRITKEETSSW